jgi:hypothetical protein
VAHSKPALVNAFRSAGRMRAWRRPDRCARARRDHPLTAGQRRRLAWRHRLQQASASSPASVRRSGSRPRGESGAVEGRRRPGREQPRHSALRPLGRLQPPRQKCGLAEPSRCRAEDQPRPCGSVHAQLVGKPGARHQPATRRGTCSVVLNTGMRSASARSSLSADERAPSAAQLPSLRRSLEHVVVLLLNGGCGSGSR